jgi:aryl-alcohol dehydrogenase-like predicted oxidoreductase
VNIRYKHDVNGLPMAWVIAHPDCTAPVVGPSRGAPHLDHLAQAHDLMLAPEECAQIASGFEAAGP